MISQKTRKVSRKTRDQMHYKLEKIRREQKQRTRKQMKKQEPETEH